MKRLAALALVCCLAAAPLAVAAPAFAQGIEPDSEEQDAAYWRALHEQVQERARVARERFEQAEAAYSKGKQRNRLRGERRIEAVEALESARAELEEAERDLEELPDRARRAGAMPGWLRD